MTHSEHIIGHRLWAWCVVLTVALASVLVPGTGSTTLAASASAMTDATPRAAAACASAPFSDVPDDHPFCTEIAWLVDAGISTGYADGTFKPGASVSRQAMAAYLARLSWDDLAPCESAAFFDIPVDHPFCEEITWLAQAGISTGYADGTFRPGASVTRQAMAAFLARFLGATPDACTSAAFSDVPADHPFCKEIAWLAETGISTGYADGTFKPSASVSRQAMAAFLYRASDAAVEPISDITTIAVGGDSSCVVAASGTVKCWGSNSSGQLGNGSTLDSPTPVEVAGLTDVTAIAMGGTHSCALIADGTVKCWGENREIGFYSSTPVEVAGLAGVTAIAVGSYHACAVTTGGTVKCWGDNLLGQLGTGDSMWSSIPVPVEDLAGVTTISAHGSNSCAVITGGTVKCWGDNREGQLGNGNIDRWWAPVDVVGLTDATAVTVGLRHSCALITGGAVQCWGYGLDGELGDGRAASSSTPVDVLGLTGVDALATGSSHTCAVTRGGSVKCWGNNWWRQLGHTNSNYSPTPVQVADLAHVIDIAASSHSCVLATDGTVKCWGINTSGQLGDGTTSDSLSPVVVRFD